MKLERDRYYYDGNGNVWRVICTDAGGKQPAIAFCDRAIRWFSIEGQIFRDRPDDIYDLCRPVFEPGQKWRHKENIDDVYTLGGICNGKWYKSGCYFISSEKWLLENCEQVKEEKEDKKDARLEDAVTLLKGAVELLEKCQEGSE